MTENEIGTTIIDSAMAVYRGLGPGLLESVYAIILEYELKQRGLQDHIKKFNNVIIHVKKTREVLLD